jgi:hypothetical protein
MLFKKMSTFWSASIKRTQTKHIKTIHVNLISSLNVNTCDEHVLATKAQLRQCLVLELFQKSNL